MSKEHMNVQKQTTCLWAHSWSERRTAKQGYAAPAVVENLRFVMRDNELRDA